MSDTLNGCDLFKLEESDSAQIVTLLRYVQANLPADNKTFIVPKGEDEIKQNLSKPHYGVGVFDAEGQLVGTAFLLAYFPPISGNALMDCPKVGQWLEGVDCLGIISTVVVHPDFRKRGLMRKMLSALQAKADEKGYPFLLTRVENGNTESLNGFMHSGFVKISEVVDPTTQTSRIVLKHKRAPVRATAPAVGLQLRECDAVL